jgi:pimeloyl-ACP methyl ester carboxylesterase
MASAKGERIDVVSPDGVRIAVELRGEPGRPPIVLLHGGAQSRSAWRGGAQMFAEHGFRVASMDLRGHGESDWSREGDYSFDRHIGDLVAVIRALGPPAVLLGASLGGHVSLLTAARHPELVSLLMLADVTPWIDEEAGDAMRETMRRAVDGYATVEEAAAMVDRLRGSASRGSASGLRPHLDEREDGRFYWRWDARFVEDRFVRHGGEGGLFALAAQSLRVPVFVMRGALSEVTSPAQIERFARAVPALSFVEISGVGHMVTGESNDAYARAALSHLAERGLSS